MDPGHDLLHLKGLDDVVIRPHLQAADLILQFPLGGHHDNGRLIGLPDLPTDPPAVQHRQHNIQQHQVRPEVVEQGDPQAAVPGHLGLKPLLLQVELEQLGDIAVIFHD